MSSPLSSTPPLSRPASFHTAVERSSEMSARPTPQSVTATNEPREDEPQEGQYRAVAPIPYEVRQHVQIFFEESLYNHALQLLKQMLISGKSLAGNPRGPAFVPPPSHIELISTILIHPLHTTRPVSHERREASTHALDYLRSLLTSVGPLNAGLSRAFRFAHADTAPRRGSKAVGKRKGRHTPEVETGEASEDEDSEISHPLAREGSVWVAARDFWHVVGWALNCSVRHRGRWEFWEVWMDYVATAMEAELKDRVSLGAECEKNRPLHASMLGRFLLEPGGAQGWKRAVAAIFADGTEGSMKQFPEVWKDEARERKKESEGSTKKKDRKVDIEKEDYGDYIGHDDSPDEDPVDTTIESDTIGVDMKPKSSDERKYWLQLGGYKAVALRIRLMGLMIRICREAPNGSFITPFQIFELFANAIAPLNYDHFTHILHIQSLDLLAPEALSSLTQIIISRLIDHKAPRNTDPSDGYDEDTLTRCFLPFAANTSSAEDNAKLSWAVEALLRLYYLNCEAEMEPTPELEQAIEAGIVARRAKAAPDRRRKAKSRKNTEDEKLREDMEESAARMRMVLDALKSGRRRAAEEKERRKVAKKEWRKRQKENKRLAREAGGKGESGEKEDPEREALAQFWEEQGLPGGRNGKEE